ncbi:MAG: tRNA uridine-5-carboxymethylaminomethyl(34) synthesis GTPase MnmE [Acidobacteria bacterium]|nr:tRNA uridine-5-carboxymethylaminomethyl(34) synthesis GTPase MnmE [Acidobacteriota bacterium]
MRARSGGRAAGSEMFATDDTIVAIATPPGPGGIGIVRLSGGRAADIGGAILAGPPRLEPRRATLTEVVAPGDSRSIDQVLATWFPGPASYTGEDVMEVSAHGSPVVLRQIVAAAMAAGARLAEPGEFTFRAYLHGRLDLPQAEAVGDLVAAVTPLQARVAFDQLEGTVTAAVAAFDRSLFDLMARLEASLDFPEEGYHFVDKAAAGGEAEALASRIDQLLDSAARGRLIREGCQVAVLGRPNVGKSTLFNLLCGAPRAIVTEVAGTTRDLLTDTVDLQGIAVTLVDTAGLRESEDVVEAEGVRRARGTLGVATAVVVVLDGSRRLEAEDRSLLEETSGRKRVIVVSKRDCPPAWEVDALEALAPATPVVEACLLPEAAGANEAQRAIATVLAHAVGSDAVEAVHDAPAVSNIRHVRSLETARAALRRTAEAAAQGATEELLLEDLQEARRALEAIAGRRAPDALIERIFSSFCIGK